ncbi:MAG: ParB N-terminal domain-containing protein [Treponema sp.]|nr:ParB N-terminal domain-containing protein [Treponema sp.]
MAKRRSLMDAMGNTIDEIETGGSFTGAKQLSQMVPLKDIKLDPEFQALFPLDEDMVADVARSIEESGFDPTQPLVIWKENNTLLDGHTRYAASEKVRLFDVPVFYKSFANRDAAMFYALGLQLFRRNLSQQQLIFAADRLIKLGEKTGNARIKDIRMSLEKRLDVGAKTAQKIIAVARDEEARGAVESGEKTINQAYNDMDKREYTREVREEEPAENQIEEESPDSEGDAADAAGTDYDGASGPAAGISDGRASCEDEPEDSGLSGDFSMVEEGPADGEPEDGVPEDDCSGEGPYEGQDGDDGADDSVPEEVPVRQAPAAREAPSRAEAKSQRMPERRSEKLPEADAGDGEYLEDNDADQNFVEGFKMAFWYVLAEVERKTTVDEVLSWFAKRNAFSADALRAFEIPDYDVSIQENLKGRLREMMKK